MWFSCFSKMGRYGPVRRGLEKMIKQTNKKTKKKPNKKHPKQKNQGEKKKKSKTFPGAQMVAYGTCLKDSHWMLCSLGQSPSSTMEVLQPLELSIISVNLLMTQYYLNESTHIWLLFIYININVLLWYCISNKLTFDSRLYSPGTGKKLWYVFSDTFGAVQPFYRVHLTVFCVLFLTCIHSRQQSSSYRVCCECILTAVPICISWIHNTKCVVKSLWKVIMHAQ